MKHFYLLMLLAACTPPRHATHNSHAAKIFRINSTHTSFPDPARENGHLYDSVLYDASSHYHDNSVLIIVPPNFSPGEDINMVFWFHGWRNNIDSANNRFELSEQFINSNRNAVLVFAETAKNSPDSYGGKLEKPGTFDSLVDDITNELNRQKIISAKPKEINISLAGHSGAYRVIAYILQNSGQKVHEVFLFDALYEEVPKFLSWIKKGPKNIFIHWYTNKGGGTDEVSVEMMKHLQEENLVFGQVEEATISAGQIKNNRILFVHSLREHNDIIDKPGNFQLLLQTLK